MQSKGEPLAVLAAVVVVLVVLFGSHLLRRTQAVSTTRKGATEFLMHTAEWTKWMAGIQTAALGVLALAALDKDYSQGRTFDDLQQMLAVFTFVFLGSALFASAWVLSSIPSQSIRLNSIAAKEDELKEAFDIYEQPLYGWLGPKSGKCQRKTAFTFGYLLTVKHTLWTLGLLSVGALAITIYLSPHEKKPDPPMPVVIVK